MTPPVIDWARYAADPEGVAREIGAACRGPGFFLLTGHGIAPSLVDEVFAQTARFFALPEAAKAPLSILKSPHNRGWAAEGAEALDNTSR